MNADTPEYLTATQAVGYLASQGHRPLSPGTFTRYVRRGYGPAPDARIGPQKTRVWLPATLDQWAAQRPGQGRRRTSSDSS